MNRMNCPSCRSVLGIKPEYEGKKIKCPKCQTVMQVPMMSAVEATPAPKPPPVPPALPKAEAIQERPAARRERLIDEEDDDRPRPKRRDRDDDEDDRPKRRRDREEDDDDRPRRRRERDDEDDDDRPRKRDRDRDDEEDWDDDRPRKKGNLRAQLKAINTGMALYYARFLCMGVGTSIGAVCVLMILIGGLARSIELIQGVAIPSIFASILMGVAAPILGVIGGAFSIRCPSRTGAKGLAIAATALDAVLLFSIVVHYVSVGMVIANPFQGRQAGAIVFINVIILFLAWVASFVLTMVLLRFLAQYVKDRGSTSDSITLMIVFLAVSIGGAVLVFVLGVTLGRAGIAGGIILLLITIGWLAVLAIVLFRIAALCQTLRAQY
ncbi:MAG: zinc-ribbon domain-containing protein [Gemmataceae bacterium]|nr:zinc-ribbon domain-containing protein [Gemmataceae bacterium]